MFHFDRTNPVHMLRLFGVLATVSVLLILGLAAFGVHSVVNREIVREAEDNATRIGTAIFDRERELVFLPGPDGTARLDLPATAIALMDLRMRRYLTPFNMRKIKVFSADRRVVYSTDKSIIGRIENANPRLEAALTAGHIHSEVERKNQMPDFDGDPVYGVEIVETYIPVRDGDRIVGAFELYSDITSSRERVWRMVTYTLGILALILSGVFTGLHLIVRQVAGRLKAAQDELHALAATDVLTGVPNRRYVLDRVKAETASLRRNLGRGTPASAIGFIMFDIDHFKRVNDTYGHQIGDEVLRETAARIKRSLREYDVVGRYGGEEFLIVLPHTDLADAIGVAERIHHMMRETPFATAAGPITVTASLGVACADEREPSAEVAIRNADQLLYQAKNDGRDRVEPKLPSPAA